MAEHGIKETTTKKTCESVKRMVKMTSITKEFTGSGN